MFVGPFDGGTARRLAGLDEDDQRFDVLIDELVHASLVVADTSGSSTSTGCSRACDDCTWSASRPAVGRDAAFDRFADEALQRARDIRGSTTAWRPELVDDMLRAYDDLAEALRWCNRHDTDPQRAWRLCACMWASCTRAAPTTW